MIPFLISSFERAALSNLVKECFGSDFPDILGKPQISYLYRYLKDLGAASVLLEPEYVDRDFLDDYAKFYSRQFGNRGHRCARLHFFASTVTHEIIERAVVGEDPAAASNELARAYLGFMVVRPLSRTFIGRTCLKKYPDRDLAEGKCSRLSRTYPVSLFGIELSVETVAFQEQDKVVAACATTAIWSMLHAGRLVEVGGVPSLSRITQDAINFIPRSSNEFPNKELTTKQILRAIDVCGFRHSVQNVLGQPGSALVETIGSYIRSGVPVLLICRVGRVSKDAKHPEAYVSDSGGHAVAVVGLKEGGADGPALYIHDDRMGPFARATIAAKAGYRLSEGSAWSDHPEAAVLELRNKDGDMWLPAHEVLLPMTLIAAMPRNVRTPIDAVERLAAHVKNVVVNMVRNRAPDVIDNLRGEILLRPINGLKEWFRTTTDWSSFDGDVDEKSLDADQLKAARLRFLTKNSARYHWVLDVHQGEAHFMRILVDATDVPQGDAVSAVLYPRQAHAAVVKMASELSRVSPEAEVEDMGAGALYASLIRKLRRKSGGLAHYLADRFGSLRAPKYIKPEEIESSRLTENESRTVFYRRSERSLDTIFPSRGDDYLIWVIDQEGSLIIGIERQGSNIGHPALTGSKPARIAGELFRSGDGPWQVNAESGRYSRDYSNSSALLENAVERMTEIFERAGDSFESTGPRLRT